MLRLPVVMAALVGLALPVRAAPPVYFEEERPPLTIGLARGFGLGAMQTSAKVISAFLTTKLGRRVQARAFYDSNDLGAALAKGNIDLAWMSPAAYVHAATKARVTLIRKSRRHSMPYYRSVIFVRKESSARRLGDLRGKSIAWGANGSASGNIVPRAMLLEQKIDLAKLFEKQLELKDHAEVCNAVYTGRVDAGASFGEERPDLGEPEVDGCLPMFAGKLDAFRIIEKSEPIPNDVVAARAGLATEVSDAVGRAIEDLKPGDPILADGFRCDGFETGNDREFDTLRRALELTRAAK